MAHRYSYKFVQNALPAKISEWYRVICASCTGGLCLPSTSQTGKRAESCLMVAQRGACSSFGEAVVHALRSEALPFER